MKGRLCVRWSSWRVSGVWSLDERYVTKFSESLRDEDDEDAGNRENRENTYQKQYPNHSQTQTQTPTGKLVNFPFQRDIN